MPMSHDELQAAIWNDERHLPPGTREVALADEWPVPGKALIPKRPRLVVVAG